MAQAREIVCEVCGTANPPTATDCVQCGVRLKVAKGGEVERLLEELIQPAEVAGEKAGGEAGEESLDLDKEIVDELLDSLLVETSAAEAAEAPKPAAAEAPAATPGPAEVDKFECPVCGAEVSE